MTYNWSDEELVAAVASSQSWRAVARALGVNGMSGGGVMRIKRRAKELNLDSSHFTGQRRWTDADLREAVATSSTWTEAIAKLTKAMDGKNRVKVKGHAVRLGLDTSHLDRPREQPDVRLADVMSPVRQGLRSAGESVAVAWFAMRAFDVAVPAHPCAYDLLVTFPWGVQRVQVKTSTRRDKRWGTWSVGIGKRPYVLDKTASRQPYEPDELDYFFVIDGDGEMYLVPSRVVAGRTSLSVGAYSQFSVGNCAGIWGGESLVPIAAVPSMSL